MQGLFFRVDGADLETGEETYLVLQAPSAEDAEQIARKQGLLIAGVRAATADDWGIPAVAVVPTSTPVALTAEVVTFEGADTVTATVESSPSQATAAPPDNSNDIAFATEALSMDDRAPASTAPIAAETEARLEPIAPSSAKPAAESSPIPIAALPAKRIAAVAVRTATSVPAPARPRVSVAGPRNIIAPRNLASPSGGRPSAISGSRLPPSSTQARPPAISKTPAPINARGSAASTGTAGKVVIPPRPVPATQQPKRPMRLTPPVVKRIPPTIAPAPANAAAVAAAPAPIASLSPAAPSPAPALPEAAEQPQVSQPELAIQAVVEAPLAAVSPAPPAEAPAPVIDPTPPAVAPKSSELAPAARPSLALAEAALISSEPTAASPPALAPVEIGPPEIEPPAQEPISITLVDIEALPAATTLEALVRPHSSESNSQFTTGELISGSGIEQIITKMAWDQTAHAVEHSAGSALERLASAEAAPYTPAHANLQASSDEYPSLPMSLAADEATVAAALAPAEPEPAEPEPTPAEEFAAAEPFAAPAPEPETEPAARPEPVSSHKPQLVEARVARRRPARQPVEQTNGMRIWFYLFGPFSILAAIGGIGVVIYTVTRVPPPDAPDLDRLDFHIQNLTQILLGGILLLSGLLIFATTILAYIVGAVRSGNSSR